MVGMMIVVFWEVCGGVVVCVMLNMLVVIGCGIIVVVVVDYVSFV